MKHIIIIEKADIRGFFRTRLGRLEHVGPYHKDTPTKYFTVEDPFTPMPYTTEQANEIGEKLSDEEIANIWGIYKQRKGSLKPHFGSKEEIKAYGHWALGNQMLREIVQSHFGYVGEETEPPTITTIDEILRRRKEKGEDMKHVVIQKSMVAPFSRVVMGKVQHVSGWLMPEKYGKTYEPTTRGVMNYIQDHIGIKGYTDILKRCASESTYIMEGVQSAFLDVTNAGRGTFEKMAREKPEQLKPFLGAIFNHVQEDVVALKKDLRKSRTAGAKRRIDGLRNSK